MIQIDDSLWCIYSFIDKLSVYYTLFSLAFPSVCLICSCFLFIPVRVTCFSCYTSTCSSFFESIERKGNLELIEVREKNINKIQEKRLIAMKAINNDH